MRIINMEQAQSTGCLSRITVESVRNDFENWRNNKTTHKIPDYLSGMADLSWE